MSAVMVGVGVKWYHYRERQDKPYGPHYVENYYYRYARQVVAAAHMERVVEEEEEEEGGGSRRKRRRGRRGRMNTGDCCMVK